MKKYKNKDGIELSLTSTDLHSKLVKEVISEAIKIMSTHDRSCKISMGVAMHHCKEFLKTNFDLENNK